MARETEGAAPKSPAKLLGFSNSPSMANAETATPPIIILKRISLTNSFRLTFPPPDSSPEPRVASAAIKKCGESESTPRYRPADIDQAALRDLRFSLGCSSSSSPESPCWASTLISFANSVSFSSVSLSSAKVSLRRDACSDSPRSSA